MSKIKNSKIISCQKLFHVSIFLFILSILTQVYISNLLAIKSRQISVALIRERELEKDISELELKISNNESLGYIEERARALGLVKNTDDMLTLSKYTETAFLQDQ